MFPRHCSLINIINDLVCNLNITETTTFLCDRPDCLPSAYPLISQKCYYVSLTTRELKMQQDTVSSSEPESGKATFNDPTHIISLPHLTVTLRATQRNVHLKFWQHFTVFIKFKY